MQARTLGTVAPNGFWRVLLLLVGLGAFGPAAAGALAPGEMPVLAPDEGLLLIEVDTNLTLNHVQVTPVGKHAGPTLNLMLERIFGDPRTQRDSMMANSPVYQYRSLKVPVMLVHGEEDLRVDYEHTRRLVRMLNLAGARPISLTFAEGDHSLGDPDQIDATYRGVAGFLETYLGTAATAAH